jgi:hypothetical protein
VLEFLRGYIVCGFSELKRNSGAERKESMRNLKRAILAVALATLVFAAYSAFATDTLGDISRGAYTDAGVFGTGGSGTATGNYLTGFYTGAGANEYRSFFTFDLSGVSGTVTSAQFNVSLTEDGGGPSPVTLNLVEYLGDISTLDSGGAGLAGFAGLASGPLLGSATLNTSDTGTLSITLNGTALAAIQAAEGGDFAIGGSLIGIPPNDYIFGDSIGVPLTTLVLTTSATTPEPSSLLLMISGVVGLAGVARRKLML